MFRKITSGNTFSLKENCIISLYSLIPIKKIHRRHNAVLYRWTMSNVKKYLQISKLSPRKIKHPWIGSKTFLASCTASVIPLILIRSWGQLDQYLPLIGCQLDWKPRIISILNDSWNGWILFVKFAVLWEPHNFFQNIGLLKCQYFGI